MVRLTREQSRQHTRERLPAAAAELFTERGVTGTSVEQVAERAGSTRGAFYGDFADRDALVAELLRLRTEREPALRILIRRGRGVHGCCATSRRSATPHRCARAGRSPVSWRPTTSAPTS